VTTRRVTVGIVVVMVGLGVGEWVWYEYYIPRSGAFQYAIWHEDVDDVARWLRRHPGH
jgi:hypothetical protein